MSGKSSKTGTIFVERITLFSNGCSLRDELQYCVTTAPFFCRAGDWCASNSRAVFTHQILKVIYMYLYVPLQRPVLQSYRQKNL